MTRFKISPKDLAKELHRRFITTPDAIVRGLRMGASRGRSIIVPLTPRDRGQAAAAWKVRRISGIEKGYSLYNEAPYVGILELGARPHPVSREGVLAIAGWVQRNLGLRGKEALSVAYAIAGQIKKYGQRPTFFVQGALPALQAANAAEVNRQVEMHSRKRRPA